MLARVLARSRPDDQLVENSDGPNGVDVPKAPGRCGIDPARRRDIRVALLPPPLTGGGLLVDSIIGCGRKGLVDGVGLEDCETKDCCILAPFSGPTGEKRDGTVPARVLRAGLCMVGSGSGMKFGKSSWLGDSGIFSRRGVEFPLVGGPQMLGDTPSWAWISRALTRDTH